MVIYELLNTMMVFPLWFPLIFIIATIGLTWYVVREYKENKKWNPEGKLFKYARKYGFPIMRIHALNGFFRFVLGEKQKKGDPVFKHDIESHEGIRFDPRLQSGAVPKSYTVGGLEMLDFATNSPMALGVKNAVAFDIIKEHVQANYPQLSVFPVSMIIEVIGTPRGELAHDCLQLARQFDVDVSIPESELTKIESEVKAKLITDRKSGNLPEPTDEEIEEETKTAKAEYITNYRATWLVRQFMQIQDEVAMIPLEHSMKPNAIEHVENIVTKAKGLIKKYYPDSKVYVGRFFSFAEAFQNNPGAYTAVDIQTFMQLFERLGQLKADSKWDKYIPLLIGAGIFIVLASVGVMILSARQ